jgi:hypothetical protein
MLIWSMLVVPLCYWFDCTSIIAHLGEFVKRLGEIGSMWEWVGVIVHDYAV